MALGEVRSSERIRVTLEGLEVREVNLNSRRRELSQILYLEELNNDLSITYQELLSFS